MFTSLPSFVQGLINPSDTRNYNFTKKHIKTILTKSSHFVCKHLRITRISAAFALHISSYLLFNVYKVAHRWVRDLNAGVFRLQLGTD